MSAMTPTGLKSDDERRADLRYKVRFRVSLLREESPEVEGEVTDLSVGGCFVESGVAVREGDLLRIRFDISGHEALTVWGNVAFWVKDTGFGVRFSTFSQGGARDRLALILDEEFRRS